MVMQSMSLCAPVSDPNTNAVVYQTGGKMKKDKRVSARTALRRQGGSFFSDFGNGFLKSFNGVMDVAQQVVPTVTGVANLKRAFGKGKRGAGWFDDVFGTVGNVAKTGLSFVPLLGGRRKRGGYMVVAK